MTTREPEEPQQPALAPMTRDAAALLDQRIAAARPVPDFSAMLARARELAPHVLSEAAVARAAALPPVIPLAHAERAAPRDDAAALAPFTMALRAELDAKIAERHMASIPPPPLPRRGRKFGLAIGLVVTAAAALVLALVRPTELGRRTVDTGVEANAAGAGAPGGEAHRVEGATERHVLRASEGAGTAIRPVLPDSPSVLPDSPSRTAAAVPAVREGKAWTARDDGTSARPRARNRPDEPRPEPSLEDEAQALWERGELAAAEQKLREILTIAGRSGRSELAYGDLFALVRQLRGADGQAAVWREYLGRFPDGRFADDARASLCLRAAADARGSCWRDYLGRHPRGIHQEQAEAALAAEVAP